jgi:hypothetical protein
MLTRETLPSLVTWKSHISMIHLALFILVLMLLASCTNDGAGGPIISSLSAPTDASAELDSDRAPDSESADSDGEKDPVITMTSTSTGVTASLIWDRPTDINVAGYQIFYGKRSSEEPNPEELIDEGAGSEELGSEQSRACSHGESHAVEASPATITGLEPNTEYVFAIRAFNENESESLCSNEIVAVTPPAQP